MVRRRPIFLLILIMLVLNFSGMAAYATSETLVEVKRPNARLTLFITAQPNANVTIEIFYPDAYLLFPPDDTQSALADIFAYIGQIKTDDGGNAKFTCELGEQTGTYTIRLRGAQTMTYRVEQDASQFFAFSWSDGFNEENIYPFYRLSKRDMDDYGIESVAWQIKQELDNYPEGKRVIFINSKINELNAQLLKDIENHIWWENGVNALKAYIEPFFIKYKEIGGKVDYILGDFEKGMSNWHIAKDITKAEALEKYKEIEADPRYESEIRPLLADRGFIFNTDPSKCELYDVCYYPKTNNNYNIWNSVMSGRRSDYLNQAIFYPARASFPDVMYSNYGSSDSHGWYKLPDTYGHKTYTGGNGKKVGTHSSFSLYGPLHQIVRTIPEEYFGKTFDLTPFNGLLYANNRLRKVMLSSADKKIQPWVARQNYVGAGGTETFGNTLYYHENILHIGLCNPSPFLFWGPRYSVSDDAAMVMEQAAILSELFDELDEVAGFSDRYTLVDNLTSWNSKYILSGMYAGGRNIWRITPDLSVSEMTIENFCIDAVTPTFKIAGQTIMFPQGEIYISSNAEAKNGYWVETPAGVNPLISYDESYFTQTDDGFSAKLEIYNDYNGITTETLKDNTKIVARLSYNNKSGAAQDIMIIAAMYEGERLSDIKILSEENIPFGKDGVIIEKIPALGSNITEVSFFLWNGAGSMMPLKQKHTLTW